MTKLDLKEKAIGLRHKGLSYSEVLLQIPVARSTLSLWLRSVGLAKAQQQRLTSKRLRALRRGTLKIMAHRKRLIREIKYEASQTIGVLSPVQRLVIGAALYWAEGSKETENVKNTHLKFSNSDPEMVKLMRRWIKEFFNINFLDMKYELYVHKEADWQEAQRFWSEELEIPKDILRVYFKQHQLKNSMNPRKYFGQIRIVVPKSTNMVRKISGWIEGINKQWGVAKR